MEYRTIKLQLRATELHSFAAPFFICRLLSRRSMRIPNFDHCAVKQDPASSSFANAAIRKQFYFFGKGVTPPTRRVACIARMSLHRIYTGRTSYMYPHVGSVVYLVLSALSV
jgi:hypothetical protein